MNESSLEASLLREILKWIRVTSIPHVKKLLLDTLPTDKDKIAYENSDGVKTSREVGDTCKLGKDAIANRWNSWIILGIAEPAKIKGRTQRVFSLADFGIVIPTLGASGQGATNESEEKSDE